MVTHHIHIRIEVHMLISRIDYMIQSLSLTYVCGHGSFTTGFRFKLDLNSSAPVDYWKDAFAQSHFYQIDSYGLELWNYQLFPLGRRRYAEWHYSAVHNSIMVLISITRLDTFKLGRFETRPTSSYTFFLRLQTERNNSPLKW